LVSIKKLLKKASDGYIIKQVDKLELPVFKESRHIREYVVFSGKVQNVGFRREVYLLAAKLGLTGWVKNNEQGSVEAEIQGEELRIRFLINFMSSLRRAKVYKVESKIIDLKLEETGFEIIR